MMYTPQFVNQISHSRIDTLYVCARFHFRVVFLHIETHVDYGFCVPKIKNQSHFSILVKTTDR